MPMLLVNRAPWAVRLQRITKGICDPLQLFLWITLGPPIAKGVPIRPQPIVDHQNLGLQHEHAALVRADLFSPKRVLNVGRVRSTSLSQAFGDVPLPQPGIPSVLQPVGHAQSIDERESDTMIRSRSMVRMSAASAGTTTFGPRDVW